MACRRSVELDYTFKEYPGFVEKPAAGVVLVIPGGVAGQPELGLRELEQRTGVGVHRFTSALEIRVRDTGITRSPSQDGRVHSVLSEQRRTILPE